MEGVIVNFRGGKHTQYNDEMIIKIDSSKSKEDAAKLKGKVVTYVTPAGKQIVGKITRAHGNRGTVRVKFEKGMPGQSVGTKVKVN